MSPSPASFLTPPPPASFTKLSFPAPHTLLVTLSRPQSLNCINAAGHAELDAVWHWFDAEPRLRVGVVTGEGRAFCAGADLKEWHLSSSSSSSSSYSVSRLPASGFGGLSRRVGKKPIIAAVNGLCLGGGFEMAVNCDLVLASWWAVFGLPEAKVGVVAGAGVLPRLARTAGRQRAMEMALMGREVGAREMCRWGVCNLVVGEEGGKKDGGWVVEKAVEWAGVVAENSPDAVVVSKEGVEGGWEAGGVEEATARLVTGEAFGKMDGGENMREGLRAFGEKRRPRWVDSKL